MSLLAPPTTSSLGTTATTTTTSSISSSSSSTICWRFRQTADDANTTRSSPRCSPISPSSRSRRHRHQILSSPLTAAFAALILFASSSAWQVFALPLRVASAAVTDQTTASAAGYSITAPAAVVGAIGILLGLFLVFFGLRLYLPTIFAIGFAFGAAVGYTVLTRVEPSSGYPSRDLVLLLGSIGAGIVVGALLLCLRGLAVSLIGGAAGLYLALFLLSLRSGGLIQSDVGRLVFIAVFVVVGAIAAVVVERWAVIVGTSVVGSYLFVLGVDCFAQTGFTTAATDFLGGGGLSFGDFEANGKVWALAATFVILALIGIVTQHRANANRSFGNKL
ncbi:hypothetical protein DFJ73DRAFT_854439, partial [Zopfochytrium polystomum]